MISIENYIPLYYIAITLVLIFSLIPILLRGDISRLNFKLPIVLLLLIVICIIGFRDPYGDWRYLGDTFAYTLKYLDMESGNFEFINDPIFYGFMYFFSNTLSLNVTIFYLFCALIYVLLPYYTFKKLSGKYVFFILAVHITSFSFLGFGINGLRNGLATSVFLYALKFASSKKLYFYFIAILSVFVHSSMILPFTVFIFCMYIKNTKNYILFWLTSIITSLVFGNQIQLFFESYLKFINFFNVDKILTQVYSSSSSITTQSDILTFRFDFVIYSAFPVWIGYLYIYKFKLKDVFFEWIFNSYLLINSIWIIQMYRPFTNRFAYLSWFVIPLFIYPLLKHRFFRNQFLLISLFLILNISITLYLTFK